MAFSWDTREDMQVYSIFNTPGTKTLSVIFQPENDATRTVSVGVLVVQPLPPMHLKEKGYAISQMSTIKLEPDPSGERTYKFQRSNLNTKYF